MANHQSAFWHTLIEGLRLVHGLGNGLLSLVLWLSLITAREPRPGQAGRFFLAWLAIPILWLGLNKLLFRLEQILPYRRLALVLVGLIALGALAPLWLASVAREASWQGGE